MSQLSKSKKYDQYFDTAYLKADLKGRSVRGGAVTIASQGLRFVLRMGSTIFLARLLEPGDYGLLGMATVITGFVELFKDLGLAAATVQKDEINHAQVSTLFWINLVISCLLGIAVAASSPIVAWFYQEPRLIGITLALSTNFIFGGLTVQHQALMRRRMQFTKLAQIDIAAMSLSLVASIIAAWLGAGYWALIVMQAVNAVTIFLMSWMMCSWRPGRFVKQSGVRDMLAFGGNLTGFRTVNYFSRNLDNILIGRIWGAAQLGLYAKAYQLILLPVQQINSPINNVAMPALSSLQNDPERYKRYYYKAILLITSIGMPIVAFMFTSADKLILLLLGEQWLGVVPIFQFLIPAAYISTFNVATGWVYQSLGRADRQFRWGIISSTLNILIFIVGVQWGAIGVAAAFGLTRPLIAFPAMLYCFWKTPINLRGLLSSLLRPTMASIGSVIVVMIIQKTYMNLNSIWALLIDALLYSIFYCSIWIFFPGGRKCFSEVIDIFASIKKKK